MRLPHIVSSYSSSSPGSVLERVTSDVDIQAAAARRGRMRGGGVNIIQVSTVVVAHAFVCSLVKSVPVLWPVHSRLRGMFIVLSDHPQLCPNIDIHAHIATATSVTLSKQRGSDVSCEHKRRLPDPRSARPRRFECSGIQSRRGSQGIR